MVHLGHPRVRRAGSGVKFQLATRLDAMRWCREARSSIAHHLTAGIDFTVNSSPVGGLSRTDLLSAAIAINWQSPTVSPTLISFGCPTRRSLMKAFWTPR